eukprot:3512029-Amphidinium_carterae.1
MQLEKLPVTGYEHGMLARHQQCLTEQWVLQQSKKPTHFRPNAAFHQAYQAAMDSLRVEHTGFVSDLLTDLDRALSVQWGSSSLAFCIPSKNRLWQLRTALPISLNECKSHAGRVYQCDQLSGWSAPIAKNTSISGGSDRQAITLLLLGLPGNWSKVNILPNPT